MKRPSLADKDVFNPSEAAEYYGLSRRKFFRLLSECKDLPFVALYNTRKLIIRTEFETYFRFRPEEKEALKNGRPPVPEKAGLKASCTQER